MDPLSITSGILTILDTTEKVVKYGLDFAGASKETRVLKENFETLQSLLKRLLVRCEKAQDSQPDEEPPWLRGLWEVRGRRFNRDGVWIFEYKGTVAQLQQVIEEMAVKLNPSRAWQRAEAYQRATWHYKKDAFTEMQTTITRCCVAINTILALNNDETLNETLVVIKKNSESTRIQLANMDNRLSSFEVNQKREEERRRRRSEAKEREEIADWLAPFSFIAKRDELWANCFTETGEWLWRDRRFQAWAGGRPWFLQCVGDLGVGKTVLSSILTHHLPSNPHRRQSPVLSIYLNYKSSNVQTLPHLVGSLLKQLIQLDELYVISEELRAVYRKATRLKSSPISYFNDIHKILVKELDNYERFYIVVDAFDEIAPRDRVALQRELLKLKLERGSILIMTRPISKWSETGDYECNRCHAKGLKLAFRCKICDRGDYDLCYDCKQKGLWCLDRLHHLMEPYGQVEVRVEIPRADIERYVRREIGTELADGDPVLRDDRDTTEFENPITTPFQDLCQSDSNLPEHIVTEVAEKANGRFLFARLYMDLLKTKSNLRTLKKALRTFPDTTDDIYQDAMQRIQAQGRDERNRAYRVLGMVTRARRPLGLSELQHALAVVDLQEERDSQEDITDSIDQPKTILGSTSALVILEENGTQVRLVHRTLEDYLHHEENSNEWLPHADVEIAEACMTYLGLVLPRIPCQDEYYISKKSEFPFLQYASQYWGDHVRIASRNTEHGAKLQAAAMQLINDPQRKDNCMQAAWVTDPGGHDTWDVWRNVDKLHICAWYGLASIFSDLDPDYGRVDKLEPKYGQTPLMYACRRGHFEVARCLLSLGASQQKVSARGRTALFEAILGHHSSSNPMSSREPSEHSKIVELLVCEMPGDLDVNMVHRQEFNRTVLMLAARLGHVDQVRILLRNQAINLDLQDVNGMTALYLAAREDHYDIVELLLGSGASIDIVDFHASRSPLRCAAERNHCDMVDLLLQYNANPALKDREGGTAMLRAVNRGAKEALEKMMEYPIDMMCADEDGQSLLHGAARNGYHEIARLLMEDHLPGYRSPEVKAIHPDIRDKCNRTPLHDAAQKGQAAVVSILLEKRANMFLEDKFGRTAFMVAWQYGHETVMHMLASSGYDRSSQDLTEKQLPVWAMAKRGLTDPIAEAIKTRMQDLHILEPYTENSPLHCAIESDNSEILYLLLETKMLPVNRPNHWQRTPLHVAALEGDLFATKLLIDHGANIDMKDRWKDEPLVLAQSNQHLEIMLALIEAQATVDKQKIDANKLFFFAVEQRNVTAAKILIEKHAVDRSIQNADGVRALQIATAADDEDMMMLLRSASTVNFGDVNPGVNEQGKGKIGFVPFRSRPIQL